MILQKEDFERLATDVVSKYLKEKVPLNDTILKVAQDHEMNPDQIKRLVEAANVKTFMEMYNDPKNKESSIEYDVAEPKEILSKYYSPSKSISITKTTITVSRPEGNDFFTDLPDMTRNSRHGELAKAASVEEETDQKILPNREGVIFKLRNVADMFETKKYEEEHEYIFGLEKLSSEFAKLYGPDYHDFERDALLLHGECVKPLLDDIRRNIRYSKSYPNLEKIARIVIEDTPELKVFEKMVQHKKDQVKYAEAAKLARRKLRALIG